MTFMARDKLLTLSYLYQTHISTTNRINMPVFGTKRQWLYGKNRSSGNIYWGYSYPLRLGSEI